MADASNVLTYDQDPPHRPTLEELGGGAKENDPDFAPDPVKHPRAEEFNQFSQILAAWGKCHFLAKLHVRFASGTPTIEAIQAPGNAIQASDFTFTDDGAGNTHIGWTTGVGGKLPPTTGFPEISIAADGDTTGTAVYEAKDGRPGVRVKTRTGGTLADAAFVVTIN